MSTHNSIIAVIEPEVQPHEVCERAAWLARLMGCDVELLLCDPDVGSLHKGWLLSTSAKEIAEKIAAAQEEMAREFAGQIRDAGISVTTKVLNERPLSDAILQHVGDSLPRMVVKGTEHHTAAKRSILVATDWELIRSCPVPLYLVKSRGIDERPVIVAAVDPTHDHDKPAALDDIIVKAAQELASKADGEVHLLHTYTRLSGIGAESTRTFKPIKLPIEKLDQRIKEDHRRKLDALAEAHGVDSGHVHQLPGRTREIIPKFCRAKGADIAVMGALARWGIRRAVIGSTTERVLDLLPCDVLVVRGGESDS